MRAWLALLSERHPDVNWVAVEEEKPSARGSRKRLDSGCEASDGSAVSEILIAAA
jgi:hypothetical protein